MYDAIIVGSGTSGSFLAYSLVNEGVDCLMLEAGEFFHRQNYPKKQAESSSRMFWAGGMELNTDFNLGLLRPKCVGGGSIVNQALMDRFDRDAFESWRRASGVSFFTLDEMDPWYERAEDEISLQHVPEEYRNRNAEIFRNGSQANDYGYHDLRRAQRNCRYEDGNDCIECLSGCDIDSKQSMTVTVLKDALDRGLDLLSEFEVTRIKKTNGTVNVLGTESDGSVRKFKAGNLILAAGAVGNSLLLANSGFDEALPAVGDGFYSHPQSMVFGLYHDPVSAYEGGFQSTASSDDTFRDREFKLENVFGPPSQLALLFDGVGRSHQSKMKMVDHYACTEVAIRDTNPGTIRTDDNGNPVIEKRLNREDRRRRNDGINAIKNIYRSTGAKQILVGDPNFSLHLMGGCAIGTDPSDSVVSPKFHLHGEKNIYAADSSIFPDAPGINPALTIMALSLMAGNEIADRS